MGGYGAKEYEKSEKQRMQNGDAIWDKRTKFCGWEQ